MGKRGFYKSIDLVINLFFCSIYFEQGCQIMLWSSTQMVTPPVGIQYINTSRRSTVWARETIVMVTSRSEPGMKRKLLLPCLTSREGDYNLVQNFPWICVICNRIVRWEGKGCGHCRSCCQISIWNLIDAKLMLNSQSDEKTDDLEIFYSSFQEGRGLLFRVSQNAGLFF